MNEINECLLSISKFLINNSTTLAALAAFVGSIAALSTARQGKAQLDEMKEQRIAGSKPEVIINNLSLLVSWNPLKTKIPIYWNINPEDIIYGQEPLPTKFELLNIGNGPMIDVKIKWSVDLDKLINIIQELDKEELYNIAKEDNYITIISSEGSFRSNLEKSLQQEEKFLLPYDNNNKQIYYLYLPDVLRKLVSIIYYLSEKEKNNENLNLTISLNVAYTDINNKSYDMSFDVNVNVYMIFKVGDIAQLVGNIEFTRK